MHFLVFLRNNFLNTQVPKMQGWAEQKINLNEINFFRFFSLIFGPKINFLAYNVKKTLECPGHEIFEIKNASKQATLTSIYTFNLIFL